MTAEQSIVVTETDRTRLEAMIRSLEAVGDPYRAHTRELEEEMSRATLVPASQVDRDVVTMNSQVCTRDVDSGEVRYFTLAYHDEDDMFGSKVSVLNSLGIRLLGARLGDVIEWRIPRGVRRLQIERIPYQPEAAGNLNL